MVTVITVATEDTANGNVVRRKETKQNNKRHKTENGSKQNGQSTTLNWYAKTVVIQDTQLVNATTNKKKH